MFAIGADIVNNRQQGRVYCIEFSLACCQKGMDGLPCIVSHE